MVRNSDQEVWYVAYGSNLLTARMLAYLEGSTEDSLWGKHRGAKDPTFPRDAQKIEVPYPIRFGGYSQRWKGGVAWCPHKVLSGKEIAPIGRAWRITRGQLADIVAQENRKETKEISIPDNFPKPGEAFKTNDGLIDLLISLDQIVGVPAVTLGSSSPPPPGPPSPSYRAVLVAGMSEMGLTSAEIMEYLSVLET
ncbi:MAG TPA: hypothetical protein QF762_08550 [Acidimicrobiales bacterium]|nr:hypothetical protein [Acidimicrobiales bacterium]